MVAQSRVHGHEQCQSYLSSPDHHPTDPALEADQGMAHVFEPRVMHNPGFAAPFRVGPVAHITLEPVLVPAIPSSWVGAGHTDLQSGALQPREPPHVWLEKAVHHGRDGVLAEPPQLAVEAQHYVVILPKTAQACVVAKGPLKPPPSRWILEPLVLHAVPYVRDQVWHVSCPVQHLFISPGVAVEYICPSTPLWGVYNFVYANVLDRQCAVWGPLLQHRHEPH